MDKLCKILISAALMLCITTANASPYFSSSSFEDWQMLLDPMPGANFIRPSDPLEWQHFEIQRAEFLVEGDPIPESVFLPPDLFVFEGDPTIPEYPDEPCLIMAWGDKEMPEGDYSSGYSVVYGVDPDLSSSIITLSVHPPAAITMVAFGLTDINNNQCSWTWYVPANIPPSPPGSPTTITINTNDIPGLGVNSSSPACTTFSYNPAFDITKVASLYINETFHNTPGIYPPPPPGQTLNFYWNAWGTVSVQPFTQPQSAYKGYHVKYSQKPYEMEPGMIYGWDQASMFYYDLAGQALVFMAADDWVCTDPRPVTDFHWWGSFKGWTENRPPTLVPDYFLIGIWRDVPSNPDQPYSHPRELLWVHHCDKWVWNYAGIDIDPKCNYPPDLIDPDYFAKIGQYFLEFPPCEIDETCFQFNQLLSQDEYFFQEEGDNIYWLSIAAVYKNIPDPRQIPHPWGWKTKPHDPDKAPDVAVIINDIDKWPLQPGITNVTGFKPIILPSEKEPQERFDLCFELTTNQKEPGTCYDIEGDINHDCIVDVADFRVLAADWLTTSTP
jgi:hypothetical protein